MGYKESSVEEGIRKLVYGITHDMSGPLRAIVQFSTLLQTSCGDKLDEKERYWLELIHNGGLEAQQMIDALLVYSRLTPTPEDQGEVDLHALINKSSQRHAASCTRETELDLILDGQLFASYPRLWECLVDEALANAYKFHPDDKDHRPKIRVSLNDDSEQQLLCFEDNGIGISSDNLELVSTPYKKLNGNEYQGNGMGLSYIDRICNLTQSSYTLDESDLGGVKLIIAIPKIS